MRKSTPFVIAIIGPTAVGKSMLAEQLAIEQGSCVISSDSMQIYRGLDIGTAKVDLRWAKVPYFGIDIADPLQPYSVANFQKYARDIIDQQLSGGKCPVVCGGSGLYVRGVLDDMKLVAGEQINNPNRKKWEDYLMRNNAKALHSQLFARDPRAAEAIHMNNTRRVIRALEMHEVGQSYASQLEGFSHYREYYSTCYVGLTIARELLYKRINARVDNMMETGLLEEVRTLMPIGVDSSYSASQAIGYKELFAYLKGEETLDCAIELIKRNSRRYAKRQLTWLRRDRRIQWIDTTKKSDDQVFEDACEIVRDFTDKELG